MTNYLNSKDEINKQVVEKLVSMLSVFIPHTCEEVWETIGNKGFISIHDWPKFDESKIDLEAEALEENIKQTISDIRRVLELIKIEKPSKIKLIVSQKWKYDFYKRLKEEIEKTRDMKILMAKFMTDFKQYGGEISKIIPSVAKDASKLPNIVVSYEDELKNLKGSASLIEEEFKCDVIIEEAEKSSEQKAKAAYPGKPSIVVQ
jgi:leucyl-tRNA synthetase